MKIRNFFTSILGLIIAIGISFLLFEVTMKLSGDEIVSVAVAIISFSILFFDLLID